MCSITCPVTPAPHRFLAIPLQEGRKGEPVTTAGIPNLNTKKKKEIEPGLIKYGCLYKWRYILNYPAVWREAEKIFVAVHCCLFFVFFFTMYRVLLYP